MTAMDCASSAQPATTGVRSRLGSRFARVRHVTPSLIPMLQATVHALRVGAPDTQERLEEAYTACMEWADVSSTRARISGKVDPAREVRVFMAQLAVLDCATEGGRLEAAAIFERTRWYLREVEGP